MLGLLRFWGHPLGGIGLFLWLPLVWTAQKRAFLRIRCPSFCQEASIGLIKQGIGPEPFGRLIPNPIGLKGRQLQKSLCHVARHCHLLESLIVADDPSLPVFVVYGGKGIGQALPAVPVETGHRKSPEMGGECAHSVFGILEGLLNPAVGMGFNDSPGSRVSLEDAGMDLMPSCFTSTNRIG